MRKYSSILATERHQPVRFLSQIARYDELNMGFFLNGKTIGKGILQKVSYVKNHRSSCLQTDYVRLDKKFRKKGHGIHLYFALIQHARRLKAKRIYSSRNLNKFSRRMWSEKLKKFFDVKEIKTRKPCSECGSKHGRVIGYYIVLRKEK